MSNFNFLPEAFKSIAESAVRAEGCIISDPRAACFHARFTLEALVHWLYRHDSDLRMPYDRHLGALLHEPTFQNILPDKVFQKARVIQKVGNQAVHNPRLVHQYDALQTVRELHHVCYWVTRVTEPHGRMIAFPNHCAPAKSCRVKNWKPCKKSWKSSIKPP